MYEVSTRRCIRLTRVVRWISTDVNNIPTFDGLNHLETFLAEFEKIVQVQQRMLALDEALKSTLARWWGAHKRNIAECTQCHTLLKVRFLEQVEGCEVHYMGQSCPKDHMRSCEEAWGKIPKEQWVNKFINTLDTTPINWYLHAEIYLITTDWYGMIQNFIATILFEIQYPIVDQALQTIRKKFFEEAHNLPFTQEGNEWIAPL
jgi:hypothetical protein